jgi:hypothetical protein
MRRAAVVLLPLLPACNEHSLQPVDLTTTSEYSATFCAAPAPLVDVLIVMDEAPSMVEEVSAIASGLEIIGDVYDSAVSRLDFRIAVVSSELAADGSAPFVDTSCRERGEAFIAPGIDLHAAGCLDVCKLAALETSSTSVDGDPVARPRPWIELLDLESNLPAGIDARDDLACRGALGFRGTQPPQPLAAMTRALAQSADPNDPAFGFIRDEASLFVLFVTDGDDASPGPVEDYAGLLASIRDVKRRALPSSPPRVLVSVIGGVGDDETLDAEHLGCASERGIAAPPLRLMQLASEFGEFPSWQGAPWFSICGDPWTDAPACVPGWSPFDSALCLEGCLDPEVPACEVARTDLVPIADCELTEDGDAVLPEGTVECAIVQTDAVSCDVAGLTILRSRGRMQGCYRTTCPIEPRSGRTCAGADW